MADDTSATGMSGDERQKLILLVHQTFGHSRFTQDSPIRPDVWMKYWEKLAEGDRNQPKLRSDPRVDLIITPVEGVASGQVAWTMVKLLAKGDPECLDNDSTDNEIRAECRLSYSRSAVQANLTFGQMLRAVVPLTGWWKGLGNAELAITPGEPRIPKGKTFEPKPVPSPFLLGEQLKQRLRPYLEKELQEIIVPAKLLGLAKPSKDLKKTPSLELSSAEKQITIDQSIRVSQASFQLYRFAALASLTQNWRWQLAMPDPKTTLAEAKDKAVELAERLTKTDARLGPILSELGQALIEVLRLIDSGTTRMSRAAQKARKLGHEPVSIHAVSVNRQASNAVSLSRKTVKADAAHSVFHIDTRGIQWAVVDSGIDIRHPAFQSVPFSSVPMPAEASTVSSKTYAPSIVKATFDFTFMRDLMSLGDYPGLAPEISGADRDEFAEELQLDPAKLSARNLDEAGRAKILDQLSDEGKLLQRDWNAFVRDKISSKGNDLKRLNDQRNIGAPLDWSLLGPLIEIPHTVKLYRRPMNEHGTHVAGTLAGSWIGAGALPHSESIGDDNLLGVCPGLELLDIRAFDHAGRGHEDTLIYAFEFIRHLNRSSSQPVVHGVNLSLAVPHDVQAFACGQTPVCQACNELVRSGVVVVAAAGNMGYEGNPAISSVGQNARDISITDPGNAELVITVGATHRDKPHTYGVSYFSSRGPTADGRMKPDLVAPGEKILGPVPLGPNPDEQPMLKRLDGTSMATPHVSGIAAMLMARNRELIGQPGRIKEILCSTATDLGRLPAFQGAGLVDALRALQSI